MNLNHATKKHIDKSARDQKVLVLITAVGTRHIRHCPPLSWETSRSPQHATNGTRGFLGKVLNHPSTKHDSLEYMCRDLTAPHRVDRVARFVLWDCVWDVQHGIICDLGFYTT